MLGYAVKNFVWHIPCIIVCFEIRDNGNAHVALHYNRCPATIANGTVDSIRNCLVPFVRRRLAYDVRLASIIASLELPFHILVVISRRIHTHHQTPLVKRIPAYCRPHGKLGHNISVLHSNAIASSGAKETNMRPANDWMLILPFFNAPLTAEQRFSMICSMLPVMHV